MSMNQTYRAHLFPCLDSDTWRVEITPDLPRGDDDYEIPLEEDQASGPVTALDTTVPLSCQDPSRVQRAAELVLLSQGGDEWYVGPWHMGHGEMLAPADRRPPFARRAVITFEPDDSFRVTVRHPMYVDPETGECDFDDLITPPVAQYTGQLACPQRSLEQLSGEVTHLLSQHGWHAAADAISLDEPFPVLLEPPGGHFALLAPSDQGWSLTIRTPQGKTLLDTDLELASEADQSREAAQLAAETVIYQHQLRPQGEWSPAPHSGPSRLRLTPAGTGAAKPSL